MRSALITLSVVLLQAVLCAGEASVDAFLKALENPDVKYEEALQVMAGHEVELSLTDAKRLMDACRKVPPGFIPTVANLVAAQHPHPVLSKLCELLESGASDPERAKAALRASRCLQSTEAAPEMENVLPTAFWKAVAEIKDASVAAKLLDPELDLVLMSQLDPAKAAAPLVHAVSVAKDQTQLLALTVLNDTYAAFAIGENEFERLIEALSSPSPMVVEKTAGLLARMSHGQPAREPGQPQRECWLKWWRDNAKSYSLEKTALKIMGAKALFPDERYDAMQQLVFLKTAAARKNALASFQAIAVDAVDNLDVRKAAVSKLFNALRDPAYWGLTPQDKAALQQALLHRVKSDALELQCQIIQGFHFFANIADASVVEILTPIYKDPGRELALRAAAALVLAGVLDKAEILNAVTGFMKAAAAQPKGTQRTLAILSCRQTLCTLTKQDHGEDWQAWANALTNPAPVVATPATVPAGENPANFRIVPRFLESARRYDFDMKTPQFHFLALNANLVFPTRMDVLAAGGYVIEEVTTDTGERLIQDWQKTIMEERPVYDWESPRADPAKFRTQDRGLLLNLGTPKNALQGLARVKGYVVVKHAAALKIVDVRPSQWAGRIIDLPDLKPMSMQVLVENEKLLVIEHSISFAHFARLRSMDVVNADGERIQWSLREKSVHRDRGVIRFEFELASAFPAEGKILLALFDGVKEERVPFEFKDSKLESASVKPPAPPDF